MGLFKRLLPKSNPKQRQHAPQPTGQYLPSRWAHDFSIRLPETVLAKIFIFVCPHTRDESYEPCEQSQIGEGCMLCDLRDLAACAQVCRKWYSIAQTLLYRSIRIDAVHYCELEEVLAEKRRKTAKSLRNKGRHAVDAGEVPNVRLALLARTLRDNHRLANQVLLLKLPYMTRETAKGELARAISALQNLRYVDLPDAFFSAESSTLTLRQELQARCPDIRKMAYHAGAEDALEWLANRHWQSLQILELSRLALEPAILRVVLASLPSLRELTLANMDWIDDSVFHPSPGRLPDFPQLQMLKLENTPHVTADSLVHYLEVPQNRGALQSLTLHNTGIVVSELHGVIWEASALRHLAVLDAVSKSMTLSSQTLPPLASISLETLHFEIVSSDDVHGLQKPAESYYAYLASSLHQNSLPALRTLYVRDQTFPDLLLLPPLAGPGMGSPQSLREKTNSVSLHMPPNARSFVDGGGFKQTLEVFSKGLDELEWIFTAVTPPSQLGDGRGSAQGGRPLSAYSASRGLGPQWAQGGFGGEARKSVIVGNGFGGFLAVPQDEVPRPVSSAGSVRSFSGNHWDSQNVHLREPLKPPPSLSTLTVQERRASRHDLWR